MQKFQTCFAKRCPEGKGLLLYGQHPERKRNSCIFEGFLLLDCRVLQCRIFTEFNIVNSIAEIHGGIKLRIR